MQGLYYLLNLAGYSTLNQEYKTMVKMVIFAQIFVKQWFRSPGATFRGRKIGVLACVLHFKSDKTGQFQTLGASTLLLVLSPSRGCVRHFNFLLQALESLVPPVVLLFLLEVVWMLSYHSRRRRRAATIIATCTCSITCEHKRDDWHHELNEC